MLFIVILSNGFLVIGTTCLKHIKLAELKIVITTMYAKQRRTSYVSIKRGNLQCQQDNSLVPIHHKCHRSVQLSPVKHMQWTMSLFFSPHVQFNGNYVQS